MCFKELQRRTKNISCAIHVFHMFHGFLRQFKKGDAVHTFLNLYIQQLQSQKQVLPKLLMVDNSKKPLLKWERKLFNESRSVAKQ